MAKEKDLSLVFMGTPGFAVPALRMLHEKGFNLLGVVTQPDRPRGRGRKISASPVKEEALRLGLRVFQPEKVREDAFLAEMKALKPQLVVVVAFGQILPKELLAIPPLGCINVHASLLPAYRGAAPIQWAIINGERETGISIMLMDEGLDTGAVLAQEKVAIPDDMTSGQLQEMLAHKGAELLTKTIRLWEKGEIEPLPQDKNRASYAPLLKREHERIDWENTAFKIHNQIRGLEPWPGAYTIFKGKQLKIRGACLWEPCQGIERAGTVLELVKGTGFVVQTGEGCLLVTRVQPFGKNTMASESFINGYNLQKGYIFND